MSLRRQRVCVHFAGVQHDACKENVRYDTFDMKTLPCLARGGVCPSYRAPTIEELEADEQAFQATIERIGKAREAIVAVTRGARKVAGQTPCPNCDGTLRYGVAGNGHIHAACTTSDCAAWME